MTNILNAPWIGICLLTAAASAWGHQASPVDVSVESILARRGDSYLHLTNHTRESHTMAFSAGVAGTVNFRQIRGIVISPGAILDVNLGPLEIADGTQILHISSTVTVAGGGAVPGPELQEILEVSSTGILRLASNAPFWREERPSAAAVHRCVSISMAATMTPADCTPGVPFRPRERRYRGGAGRRGEHVRVVKQETARTA